LGINYTIINFQKTKQQIDIVTKKSTKKIEKQGNNFKPKVSIKKTSKQQKIRNYENKFKNIGLVFSNNCISKL
jgi:hypothetical protein